MRLSNKFRAAIGAALVVIAQVPAMSETSYPPIPTKKLYANNDLRGKEAPALTVEQWLTKAPVDTKGKVVLIDIWATWCPDCQVLIPELNEYQKRFGKDLVIIGISDEDPEKVKKFMEKTSMDYFVGIDTKKTMKSAIGVVGIPHVLVISPDHIVRWQGFPAKSADKLDGDMIAQIIAASKAK